MRIFLFTRRRLGQWIVSAWLLFGLIFLCLWYRQHMALPVLAEPVYRGNEQRREVAITFNVFWGEDYILPLLAILEEYQVRATFFIGGQWAEKNRELVEQIFARGHEIGSHGYSHPHPDQLSVAENREEIRRCHEILRNITGQEPRLFAPPYGERGRNVLLAAEAEGYRTILWSVDTIDWRNPPPGVIVNRVVKKIHNGAIILMHPTEPTTKALPEILNYFKTHGYRCVTVSELLAN